MQLSIVYYRIAIDCTSIPYACDFEFHPRNGSNAPLASR